MKKTSKIFFSSFVIAFGLLLFAPQMFSQTFKATVVGVVTDSTGAVVPNATVKIIQDGTNQSQTVTTNEDGSYVINQLDPGNYTLRVESPNFKAAVKTVLVLETVLSTREIFLPRRAMIKLCAVTSLVQVSADRCHFLILAKADRLLRREKTARFSLFRMKERARNARIRHFQPRRVQTGCKAISATFWVRATI